MALVRALAPPDQIVLIVDFGARSTSIAIAKNGQLRFLAQLLQPATHLPVPLPKFWESASNKQKNIKRHMVFLESTLRVRSKKHLNRFLD